MAFRGWRFVGQNRFRAVGAITMALLGVVVLTVPAVAQQPRTAASGPIPGQEAAKRMKLPEGFTVSLFAAEPDVVQPIAMTIDHEGGSGSSRTTRTRSGWEVRAARTAS